jgi:starch phosphorylase
LSTQGATAEAALRAAASASRELLVQRWLRTQREDASPDMPRASRRVHYLSMEFLMGRALGNALSALGLEGELREALASLGH